MAPFSNIGAFQSAKVIPFFKDSTDKKTIDSGAKSNYITPPWATVAQLVEHLTRNEDVCGSTPHGGSKKRIMQCTFNVDLERLSQI